MKYRVLFLLLFAGCLSTNAAVRVTGMKVLGNSLNHTANLLSPR